ncbi:MAG: protein kinase [Rickettsiales bacterium]|jgi:serine/threonine protein kinase|nr:protein kinase [Rickettsiales bacterium]
MSETDSKDLEIQLLSQQLSKLFPDSIGKSSEVKFTKIGSGTAGRIYMASNVKINERPVAIKLFGGEQFDLSLGEFLYAENFKDEMAKYPGLLKVFGAEKFTHEGKQFGIVLMEYCEKGDMETLLEKNPGGARMIMAKNFVSILYAVSAIHAKSYAHRDLKPGNIFIREDDTLAIGDPGGLLGPSMNTSKHKGTPLFMAPEIITSPNTSESINCMSDVWAIGMTIIYTMSGKNMTWGEDVRTVPQLIEIMKDRNCVSTKIELMVKSVEGLNILYKRTLCGMCAYDPVDRLSLEQAIMFTDGEEVMEPMEDRETGGSDIEKGLKMSREEIMRIDEQNKNLRDRLIKFRKKWLSTKATEKAKKELDDIMTYSIKIGD